MNFIGLTKVVERAITKNSPAILTGLGIAGVLTTAYFTGRASYAAAAVIESEEYQNGQAEDPKQRLKERVQLTWRLYIPAGISGAVTVGCLVAGSRISNKRTTAAYSLVALTETAFGEYKDKVVEKIGDKKEKDIRDEIAQDRVNKNPPGQQVIISGSGTVICCELHTGRYFNSDVETIRKAENAINAKILRETEATLDDFYYLVGLEPTSYSSHSGWDTGRLLELSWSAVISPDEKPCMAFEYNHVKGLL